MNKTYRDLMQYNTFEERLEYLRLYSEVGDVTFGYDRYMNQAFYKSTEWKQVRNYVILRDNGCDLGIKDRILYDDVLVHHINPVTRDDFKHSSSKLLDPDNLITVSLATHNYIHYGVQPLDKPIRFVTRTKDDTTLWKK